MKLFSLFAGVIVGIAISLGGGSDRAHASDLLPHTSMVFVQQASIQENPPVDEVQLQERKMFEDKDLMLFVLFCVLILIGISWIGRGSPDPDPDDDQPGPRSNGRRNPARRKRGGRPIDGYPSFPRARRRGERIDGAYLEDMDYGPSTGGGSWLDAIIGPSGGDHGFNGGGGDFGGGGADGSFDGGSDGGDGGGGE